MNLAYTINLNLPETDNIAVFNATRSARLTERAAVVQPPFHGSVRGRRIVTTGVASARVNPWSSPARCAVGLCALRCVAVWSGKEKARSYAGFESGGAGNRTRVRKTSREWPYARSPEWIRGRPPPGLLALTSSPFDLDPGKAARLPPRSSRS